MSDVVELTLPAGSDLIVLARFTAVTLGSRAGFDIEEIEDLRLAVDELYFRSWPGQEPAYCGWNSCARTARSPSPAPGREASSNTPTYEQPTSRICRPG